MRSLRPDADPASHQRPSAYSRDSLEAELSGQVKRRRNNIKNEDANLTELAEPAPVDRHHPKGDNYEKEESRRRQNKQHGKPGEDDAFLTELAAPRPTEDAND